MSDKHFLLVAEDDFLIASYMQDILEAAGYAVVTCPNGRKAMEEFENHPFAAVITDLAMPTMSGDELVEQLRCDGHTVPIIVVSGHAGRDDPVAQFDVLIMSKPINADLLVEEVDALVGRH